MFVLLFLLLLPFDPSAPTSFISRLQGTHAIHSYPSLRCQCFDKRTHCFLSHRYSYHSTDVAFIIIIIISYWCIILFFEEGEDAGYGWNIEACSRRGKEGDKYTILCLAHTHTIAWRGMQARRDQRQMYVGVYRQNDVVIDHLKNGLGPLLRLSKSSDLLKSIFDLTDFASWQSSKSFRLVAFPWKLLLSLSYIPMYYKFIQRQPVFHKRFCIWNTVFYRSSRSPAPDLLLCLMTHPPLFRYTHRLFIQASHNKPQERPLIISIQS